jgi:hypothetical protein
MKKYLLILSIPILFGFTLFQKAQNEFVFSTAVTHGTSRGAWQIYASTKTATKNILIGQITLAPQVTTEFIIYSTPTASGFTGTKSDGSAYPVGIGSGNVAVSSFNYCAATTLPTGNVLWRGIVQASTTVNVSMFDGDKTFVVQPLSSIYVYMNTVGAAGQYTHVTFFFKEEYR